MKVHTDKKKDKKDCEYDDSDDYVSGTAYYGLYYRPSRRKLQIRPIYNETLCPWCGALAYTVAIGKKPIRPTRCNWCRGHIGYDKKDTAKKIVMYHKRWMFV